MQAQNLREIAWVLSSGQGRIGRSYEEQVSLGSVRTHCRTTGEPSARGTALAHTLLVISFPDAKAKENYHELGADHVVRFRQRHSAGVRERGMSRAGSQPGTAPFLRDYLLCKS